MELVIATGNKHKVEEIAALFGARARVRSLADFPAFPAPDETGLTFSENAAIKAIESSKALGPDVWVLADDSGLEVDALGGDPGVHSARYAGSHGDDAANRLKLLSELNRLSAFSGQPAARFRCVLALAQGGCLKGSWDGAVEGHIINEERGNGGFGYDSLFCPHGVDQTFAELSAEIKNSLSHRGRAMEKFIQFVDTAGSSQSTC